MEKTTEQAATEVAKTKHQVTALAMFKPLASDLRVPDSWRSGEGDGEMITSLDVTSPAGQREILAAINSEVPNIESVFNTIIIVHGVTLHPAMKLNDITGEADDLIRIVLHCADGKRYECFSAGALKSLRILRTILGPSCFSTPTKCTPRRINVGNSRSMIRLEWHL